MISVEQAEQRIAHCLPAPVPTLAPLADALGMVLAQPVLAERDHPPFDRVTHDGIALHAGQAARVFPIQSYAAAGSPRAQLKNASHCIEVATGAPLPQGCDTVLPYESLSIADRVAYMNYGIILTTGESVHRQGSDARAGQVVLAAGSRIGSIEMAILAANGMASVPVYAKPRIGILVTGDELVEVDAIVAAHQIRRSNDVMLAAALAEHGFLGAQTAWSPDDREQLRARLQAWLSKKDVLLVIGGVSRGAYDYVPGVIEELGVKELFHTVAQRPGKPLWFGVSPSGGLVFGLPGNPASCLTCLMRYVLPALRQMSGSPAAIAPPVRLAAAIPAHAQLCRFAPVRVGEDRMAEPQYTNNSGDFTGLAGSDGFVELPPRMEPYAAGETVPFYAWGSHGVP